MKKQTIILDSESRFKKRLLDSTKDYSYKMIKSENKYCSVDFLCINKNNLKSLLIEHKLKNINAEYFDSLMIGRSKLDACKKDYNNTLIIWECRNEIYYCFYSLELHASRLETINNSDVFFISKNLVSSGYDNLVESINDFLK